MAVIKEIRVYVVNIDKVEDCLDEYVPHLTDFNEEKFITEAENKGSVYTLPGFQHAFNYEEISDVSDMIYFKEVETQE